MSTSSIMPKSAEHKSMSAGYPRTDPRLDACRCKWSLYVFVKEHFAPRTASVFKTCQPFIRNMMGSWWVPDFYTKQMPSNIWSGPFSFSFPNIYLVTLQGCRKAPVLKTQQKSSSKSSDCRPSWAGFLVLRQWLAVARSALLEKFGCLSQVEARELST